MYISKYEYNVRFEQTTDITISGQHSGVIQMNKFNFQVITIKEDVIAFVQYNALKNGNGSKSQERLSLPWGFIRFYT